MKALTTCLLALLMTAGLAGQAAAHPLRLSLSQIEYSTEQKSLTISLRLFLMDVREALLFDPDNAELGFTLPSESPKAEPMLMEYLNEFFYIKANGQKLDLSIKSKQLHGEGINEALGVVFEFKNQAPLKTLEVKNAVFTDLFFDQSNIIYVHIDDDDYSMMLGKETPVHTLEF